MDMFKRRHRIGPIGLDIGSTGVRLLQLADEGDAPSVVAAAHGKLPTPGDNHVERAAHLERAIANALRQAPFSGRRVVTSLGPGEFEIKNVRLPCMPQEDLTQAAEFEAADRFDYPAGTAQLRCLPAGQVRHGNELREEVIVFGAPDDIVDERLRLLTALKLDPVAIDITPCGVARGFARFLRRAEDASAVNVFLDLGWRSATVIITRGIQLVFVKIIDVGGRHFNQGVSKTLKVPEEEAAHLRVRIMQQSAGRRGVDAAPLGDELCHTVADAVRPAAERLCREVNLCLRYFSVTFRGQRPDCLTLVGGEAHEPVVMKILREGLDVPCTIGHPLRGVRGVEAIGGHDRRTLQPAWAVATGLALRSSRWVRSDAPPQSAATSRPLVSTETDPTQRSALRV